MVAKLKSGDEVAWNTLQGKTHGKVVRKVVRTTHVQGHTAKADAEHPQYLVESSKTGARAVHKPDALKKA
jgi:hypothetical protein